MISATRLATITVILIEGSKYAQNNLRIFAIMRTRQIMFEKPLGSHVFLISKYWIMNPALGPITITNGLLFLTNISNHNFQF